MKRTLFLGAVLTLISCFAPTKPREESSAFLPLPAAISIPYSEQEAEDADTTGEVSSVTSTLHQAGAEASGRQYVALEPGESVTWTLAAAADTLVVRYSFPNSSDGAGQDGALDVLVDGTPTAELAVTSRYNWEYGTGNWGSDNVWYQGPSSGSPRHFWDEANLTFEGTLSAGQTVSVRNPSDSGATVLVDLADFELRPAAKVHPQGSVSFADYSPAADGSTDDTSKLQAALNAAAGGVLYIPEGIYKISSVNVGNVHIQGAGLWRTRFVGPLSRFKFTGGLARVSDLAVFGETSTRNDVSDAVNAFSGNPGPDTVIERVWVEHKKCAFWVGVWENPLGPTRLRITECRFRNLMADAVNFCSGTTESMVDNTQVRNSGDDGLAAWSPQLGANPVGGNNTFAHNLVQLPWLASGISLYGGGPFRVIGNTVKDTVTTGSGIYVSANFSAWSFQGVTVVEGNMLVRAGAHESDAGGPTGAIRVLASDKDMTDGIFRFRDNTIIDPLESAVSIQGSYNVGALLFDGLAVTNAPYIADVRSTARGSATFTNVSVTSGSTQWRNSAGSNFTLTHP